jgi:hypothetical protein
MRDSVAVERLLSSNHHGATGPARRLSSRVFDARVRLGESDAVVGMMLSRGQTWLCEPSQSSFTLIARSCGGGGRALSMSSTNRAQLGRAPWLRSDLIGR